jgi:hypothetical protein
MIANQYFVNVVQFKHLEAMINQALLKKIKELNSGHNFCYSVQIFCLPI